MEESIDGGAVRKHVKYYIENFGCQMNDHDVEKVSTLLHIAGYEEVREAAGADVVIVNTCCVREKAEQKFYSLYGSAENVKKKEMVPFLA